MLTNKTSSPVTVRDAAQQGEQKPILYLTITNAASPLLERVYRELIIPFFTDANDVDTLQAMQRYVLGSCELVSPSLSYRVVAAVAPDGRVVGATIFGLFFWQGATFIKGEYTVVATEARSTRILENLLMRREEASRSLCTERGLPEPAFVVIQVDARTDQLHNLCLQRIWRLRGFLRVDFPFVQLPLRDGLAAIASFDLFVKPLTNEYKLRDYLTAEEMRGIIVASATYRESARALNEYDAYRIMMEHSTRQKRVILCR